MSEIQDRPILPHEASKSVEMMFKDLEEMGLLGKSELFSGKLPQAGDLVRPRTFQKKGPEDHGFFMAFIGECCTYHAFWVDNPQRKAKDKIYIPDEKIEEVDAISWKYLRDQMSVYKKGKKKRVMVNVVCLPVPTEKDTSGMVHDVKIFDTDVYFMQKCMVNSPHWKDLLTGNCALEFWQEQNPDDPDQKFPFPYVKFWPGKGLTDQERKHYENDQFCLDSFIREKLYSSLDNWASHMQTIEKHLKEITS